MNSTFITYPMQAYIYESYPLCDAQTFTLALSRLSYTFIPPSILAFWLGVLAKLGGTSSAGFLRKKFRGRSRRVIGSAGMTG